jgi:hypothetical protein
MCRDLYEALESEEECMRTEARKIEAAILIQVFWSLQMRIRLCQKRAPSNHYLALHVHQLSEDGVCWGWECYCE